MNKNIRDYILYIILVIIFAVVGFIGIPAMF